MAVTLEEEVSLPTDREPTLRVVPMPSDANYVGDIFGGWIMSQVDIAGSIPALRYARGRVATVAVNSFIFKKPVFVGDLVSLGSFSRLLPPKAGQAVDITYWGLPGTPVVTVSFK